MCVENLVCFGIAYGLWFVGVCWLFPWQSNRKRTHKLSWDLTLIVFYVRYLCSFVFLRRKPYIFRCQHLDHMLHSVLHLTMVSRLKRCVIGLCRMSFKKVLWHSLCRLFLSRISRTSSFGRSLEFRRKDDKESKYCIRLVSISLSGIFLLASIFGCLLLLLL